MAAEQDGPVLPELVEPAEAFLLEIGVADGQRLVDDQDIGIHMRDHGEGYARRIAMPEE